MRDAAPAGDSTGRAAYREIFGIEPEAEGRAPGRVNLLGEHTDYNEGFVLPTPIPYTVLVQAARADGIVDACTDRFAQRLSRPLRSERDGTCLDYVAGCVWALAREGFDVPGGRFHITGGVPVGVGLASSAALEVAVLRALRALYSLPADDTRLALVAHRAEVEYVGVRCGLMDQMVASLGRSGKAAAWSALERFAARIQWADDVFYRMVNKEESDD